MPTVKYSVSAYTADGTTTDYLITWDYLDDDHITVEVDGVSNDDPTANHTFVKLNDTTVRVTDGIGGAIAAGSEIQIRRNTPITTRPISFADGSALLASDLNKNSDYLLYAMQEALDEVDFTVQYQEEAEGFKDETEALRDQTATYLATVQSDATDADNHRIAAALSETNAAASETAAATSETNAATSETNAATSETNAATSAAEALASQNAAALSETNAATSENNAAASAAAAAGSESGVAADAATATAKAAAAATSETNAANSATSSANSASASQTSATASAASASASATSATNAAASEAAAATSDGSAATYATNAQNSATAAATSETNAATSATNAATSETNASTSETNAANSATAAATSEANAAASYDDFDDRYLGAKASDPSTDNDGDALITGALYFNTTDDVMKVYEGSQWVAAYASLSGSLLAANNLSDVASPSAALTNLGLTGNSVLPNDAGYITISEVPANDSINKGDSSVTVVDNGTDGKVVVSIDAVDVAEFNDTHMVIPKGTTAERDSNAPIGTLRYNTTNGFFETLTSSGWGSIATPPSVTNITPNSFNGEAGATFTVDGAFFDPDTYVVFKGAGGAEYATGTVTFISSTQLSITNATNLPVADEPFRIKVTNGAGLSVESVFTIDAGNVPIFNTPSGNIATTTRWDDPISVSVQAIDAENTIAGYEVTEGTLPAGITLNGTTGAITGASTAQATTTYTFTIGATDSAGNTNTRQFNIQIVNAPPVWNSPADGSTQEITVDQAASISLSATDPEGASVSYASSNLPTGLFISGSSISGTPTAVSNNSVSVTASDGFASSVRNFFINVAAGSYAELPQRHFSLQTGCGFDATQVQNFIDGLQQVNLEIGGNPNTIFSVSTGQNDVENYNVTVDFAFFASGCGGTLANSGFWDAAHNNNGVGIGVFQVGSYDTGDTTIGALYSEDNGNTYNENTSGTATITGTDFSSSEIFQRVLQEDYLAGNYSGGNIIVPWQYYQGSMTAGDHELGPSSSVTGSNYRIVNVFTSGGKRYFYLNYNAFESAGSPINGVSTMDVYPMRLLAALLYWGTGDITGSELLYN